MNTNTEDINLVVINNWLSKHTTYENAENELKQKGLSNNFIKRYLQEFQKQKQAKRQNTGFILMGIGAFLGFISCVLTMIDAFPGLRDFFMYGLTTAGICTALYGLYMVFEK
jgi:hypothetical protein